MKIRVYAKINITLDICGRDDIGMHLLDSVMASVDGIYDEIEVVPSDTTLITMDGEQVDSSNTAYKAYHIYSSVYGERPTRISIHKGIPVGAGLGGSSADSAGVLYCMSRLYGGEVRSLAIKCGSDVPFMLQGGVCRVRDNGDNVEQIPCHIADTLIVVKPEGSVSTRDAYMLYDTQGRIYPIKTSDVVESIKAGVLPTTLLNHLEDAGITLNGDIRVVKEYLESIGVVCPIMTGSGSAVWGRVKGSIDITKISKVFPYAKICSIRDSGIEEI